MLLQLRNASTGICQFASTTLQQLWGLPSAGGTFGLRLASITGSSCNAELSLSGRICLPCSWSCAERQAGAASASGTERHGVCSECVQRKQQLDAARRGQCLWIHKSVERLSDTISGHAPNGPQGSFSKSECTVAYSSSAVHPPCSCDSVTHSALIIPSCPLLCLGLQVVRGLQRGALCGDMAGLLTWRMCAPLGGEQSLGVKPSLGGLLANMLKQKAPRMRQQVSRPLCCKAVAALVHIAGMSVNCCVHLAQVNCSMI